MPGLLAHRVAHYIFLLTMGTALFFPNLGATSFWDDDEGVNAEAAREMREAGTWIVPTFNWDLRTAKPVMLYWLQLFSYEEFGVNEWAARFPSVLLALGTLLLVYELARSMFDSSIGILAGIILGTTIEFVKLAHAATPDSALIFFITLYFWGFWMGHRNGGRHWFIPCGIASALAFLTKGPVGLLLPSAVVGAYFLWHRELLRVWDRRMIGGIVVWIFVAIPWYAIITAETRGEWTKAFFLNENVLRAAKVKENHSGIPVVYYFVCICLFFAPWSCFLWVTVRSAWRAMRSTSPESETSRRAVRFLLLIVAVFLLAFSFAATKLPNYIGPLYPALAILAARFFMNWIRGNEPNTRGWVAAGICGVALMGVLIGLGFLLAGGVLPMPFSVKKLKIYPGLENFAWLGLIPLLASIIMAVLHLRHQSAGVVGVLASSSIMLMIVFAAFPLQVLDQYKAPKPLALQSGARDLDNEVYVGSFLYSQPSVVFYVGRHVEPFGEAGVAAQHLEKPLPAFLFVPEPVWRDHVLPLVKVPFVEAARHFDFTRGCDILVIRNMK